MFDDDYLYVTRTVLGHGAARKWMANELRRDTNQLRQNDTFGVLLDTFHDRRNGFLFYTNPLGGGRRPGRHRRGQPERRLESGVGRAHRPVRGRLDRRDGHPVQVAALQVRRRPGLGHQHPARHPPQERMDAPDAGVPRVGRRRRHLPGVARSARWSAWIFRRASKNIELKPYGISR